MSLIHKANGWSLYRGDHACLLIWCRLLTRHEETLHVTYVRNIPKVFLFFSANLKPKMYFTKKKSEKYFTKLDDIKKDSQTCLYRSS